MSLECTSELISANHRNRHDAGIFKGDEIELSFIKGRNDPEYIDRSIGGRCGFGRFMYFGE